MHCAPYIAQQHRTMGGRPQSFIEGSQIISATFAGKIGSQLPFAWQPQGTHHALVPLRFLLLRRRISRQRPTPSHQRNFRKPLPKPIRQASRRRPFLVLRQCPLGFLQSRHSLPAPLPRWLLQPAQHRAGRHCRSRHPRHVPDTRQSLRPLPRRKPQVASPPTPCDSHPKSASFSPSSSQSSPSRWQQRPPLPKTPTKSSTPIPTTPRPSPRDSSSSTAISTKAPASKASLPCASKTSKPAKSINSSKSPTSTS